MKKIFLIVGGLILVVFLGRATWALIQMNKAVPQTTVDALNTQVQPAPTNNEQPLKTTNTEVINSNSVQNGIGLNVNIKTDVTTTSSCGTPGCFQQKFFDCKPATMSAAAGFLGSGIYKIVGPIDSQHCRMSFMYSKNPNPDWVNKELTCTYLNKMTNSSNPNSWEEQFKSMFELVMYGNDTASDACSGPLYSILQPEKAATKAASLGSAPTASILVNGQSNLTVAVGDKVDLVWSSTNGDIFTQSGSITGCTNTKLNTSIPLRSVGAIGSGPSSAVPSEISGCTLTSIFNVKNSTTGKQATATVVMKIK